MHACVRSHDKTNRVFTSIVSILCFSFRFCGPNFWLIILESITIHKICAMFISRQKPQTVKLYNKKSVWFIAFRWRLPPNPLQCNENRSVFGMWTTFDQYLMPVQQLIPNEIAQLFSFVQAGCSSFFFLHLLVYLLEMSLSIDI